jgi:hypothetical protein
MYDFILDASLLDIIDIDDADVYGPDDGWGENEDT